jgi:peptidyl-prolyl cis-trans isomerase B (cyclophilin B)
MTTLLLALALAQEDFSEKAKAAWKEVEAIQTMIGEIQAIGGELSKLQAAFRAAQAAEDAEKQEKIKLDFSKKQALFDELRNKIGGAIRSAEGTLEKAITESPDDVGLYHGRARLREIRNDPAGATADLELALAKKPGHALTLARLANVERVAGKWESARKRLAGVVKESPAAAAVNALLDFTMGDLEAAARGLAEALKSKAKMPADLAADAERILKMTATELELRAKEAKADDLPRMTVTTSKGDIELELFENEAPNAVANFITLAEKKFFDGLKFHRVIENFMVQGGCPRGNGTGDPGYRFGDEFPEGYRRHFRGSLSLANSGPDTNGSQFFITHRPTDWLDGKHVVCGRVLKGMNVVDAIKGGDTITKVVVTRKRDHPYEVKKLK